MVLETRIMIIDAHAHIAHWPTLDRAESLILDSMDKFGISYSLVSDCDCSEFPSIDKYGTYKVDQKQGLKDCLAFAKRHPDKIGVLVWVNPFYETIDDELINMIHENRKWIHGLKIHPYESHIRMTDKRVRPYLDLASKEGLPILIHTAMDKYSSMKFLGSVAKKYKDVTFVAAHLELLADDKDFAISIMKENPNILCDTAWVNLKDAKRVIDEVGIDRVIFGTDNPIDEELTLSNPIYAEYFKAINILSKKEREAIFYKNASRVYKIDLE